MCRQPIHLDRTLEPLRIHNGHAIVPDRPGNGLQWDEDRICRLFADQ
jgi:L-alanine-DL-glutamate epimerase-like enolase superfamily enzyme